MTSTTIDKTMSCTVSSIDIVQEMKRQFRHLDRMDRSLESMPCSIPSAAAEDEDTSIPLEGSGGERSIYNPVCIWAQQVPFNTFLITSLRLLKQSLTFAIFPFLISLFYFISPLLFSCCKLMISIVAINVICNCMKTHICMCPYVRGQVQKPFKYKLGS